MEDAGIMIPQGFIDGSALLHCGVYILAWRGEIVYVGQSTKLSARINTHCYSRGKNRQQRLDGRIVKGVVFDQIWFRSCEYGDLDEVELELIRRYRPRYNKKGKPIPQEIAGLIATVSVQAPTAIASEPRIYIRRRL